MSATRICRKCKKVLNMNGHWQTPPACFTPDPTKPKILRLCPECKPNGLQAFITIAPALGGKILSLEVNHRVIMQIPQAELEGADNQTIHMLAQVTALRRRLQQQLYQDVQQRAQAAKAKLLVLQSVEGPEARRMVINEIAELLTKMEAAGEWIFE